MPPPTTPARPTIVRQASLDNNFVTVQVTVPRDPPGPRPVVISLLGAEEALLDAGLAVVTYRLHWELLRGLAPPPPPPAPDAHPVGVWLLASPSPQTVGQGYFALIASNAGMVSRIVDYLATLRDVDATRIGIAGTSTNGFVALEATAREPRIAAALIVAAAGDYPCFLEHSSLAMNGAPLDLAPAYAHDLAAREPIAHPERLLHAAVLMVNGTTDHAVPARCARATADVFTKAYDAAGVPERFRFVLVEGAGHNDLEPRIRGEGLPWLQRWLAPAPEGDAALRPVGPRDYPGSDAGV